jgi:ribosomal protein L34
MNKIAEYKNLDWGRNVFDFRHKRNRVYIGRHILTTCRIKGRKRLLEGTCITIRSKKFGLLNTSMVLRRKVFGVVFFVDFPLYLIGALNFEVVRFSYSRRIACSRLSYARFMG